jgi:hypothetical protein
MINGKSGKVQGWLQLTTSAALVEAHAELVVDGELAAELEELGLLPGVLGEQARDGVLGAGGREDVLLVEEQALPEVGDLGAGLGLRGAVLRALSLGALSAGACTSARGGARAGARVRARVRDRAQVDDAVEARVVEQPAPVQVAEDAHVVGAVREQRVPLALLRELDGLQAAAGLDGDLVVLAEQVQPEGVRGAEEAEAGRLEDVGGLEEPGGRGLLRELEGLVQEGDVEAHAVEGAEGRRGIEGRDELVPQPRLVLRLVRPHAPELVRAPLARVVVLRADDGDDAVCRVEPGGLDVEGEHARITKTV